MFYKFSVIYSANGGFLFYIVLPVFFSFYSENKTLQLFKFIDPFSCFSEGFKILLRFRDTGEFLKPSLSFSSGIYYFFLLQVVTLNLRIGFLMDIQWMANLIYSKFVWPSFLWYFFTCSSMFICQMYFLEDMEHLNHFILFLWWV